MNCSSYLCIGADLGSLRFCPREALSDEAAFRVGCELLIAAERHGGINSCNNLHFRRPFHRGYRLRYIY